MKNVLLLLLCCLLAPGAASAAEKNVYTITSETVVLVRDLQYCMADDSACDADDYLALKASAQDTLRDMVQLMKSGRLAAMTFTPKQAGTLLGTMSSLKADMSAAGGSATACGTALQMIIMAWLSYASAIVSLISPAAGASMLPAGAPLGSLLAFLAQSLPASLFAFATGIVFTLLGLILYPACLL